MLNITRLQVRIQAIRNDVGFPNLKISDRIKITFIRYKMIMDILKRIEQKKQQLDALRPLPQAALEALKENLNVEWTYNSNAIEGNTLTLQETRLVLQEGMTVKGKSLREHFEVKNHEKAIEYLESLITNGEMQLKATDVMELHRLVLAGIEEDFAGRYRTGMVRIVGANFVPPNPRKVPDLVSELLAWANKDSNKQNIVAFATYLHHRFVWIHPYFDGNGRTGRLLMNLALMQQGYPPAVILKNDRAKYYAALNDANNQSYTKLELLIGQAIERSLDLYLEAVQFKPDNEYIPLSQLAQQPECPYDVEYLGLLARRGKIDAFKLGRNWVSSLEALRAYLNQKTKM